MRPFIALAAIALASLLAHGWRRSYRRNDSYRPYKDLYERRGEARLWSKTTGDEEAEFEADAIDETIEAKGMPRTKPRRKYQRNPGPRAMRATIRRTAARAARLRRAGEIQKAIEIERQIDTVLVEHPELLEAVQEGERRGQFHD